MLPGVEGGVSLHGCGEQVRGQRGWGGGGGPGRGRGVGGAASSLLHYVVVPLLGPGHRVLGRGDTGDLIVSIS